MADQLKYLIKHSTIHNVYTNTYPHTYIHTYSHTYICACIRIHTYTRTRIHTYAKHLCKAVFLHFAICLWTQIVIYKCCANTYSHTYIHTYIRTVMQSGLPASCNMLIALEGDKCRAAFEPLNGEIRPSSLQVVLLSVCLSLCICVYTCTCF